MFQRFSTKKIIFYVIMISIPFLFIEGLVRVYFSYRVGPSVLLYGTMFSRHQKRFDPVGTQKRDWQKNRSVGDHENRIGNFTKYYPYQKRVDQDEFGNTFRVSINAQGFRGKDFEQKKQSGVIRIVTLGASSTFGFHDRDNETYPFYLEQSLNAALPALNMQRRAQSYEPIRAFEVTNLGIPHLTTDMIYSLFMTEALALDPDVVTFYEGINDAWRIAHVFIDGKENPTQVEKLTLAKKIYAELRHRLLSVAYGELFASRYLNNGLELGLKKYDAYLQSRQGTFVENLQRIHDKCQQRGIAFIVANQQAKSYIVDRTKMKGLTYAKEKAMVREKWATTDTLKTHGKFTDWRLRNLVYFLTHNLLMEELQDWVETNHISFVHVIRAMDENRQNLVSWVHLTPEGNRIVASAFAEAILEQMRDR